MLRTKKKVLFFCIPFLVCKENGSLYKKEVTTQRVAGNLFDNNIIGGNNMRVKITLACQECKQRNYNTMKNKKNDPDRLEMNKYCKFCRKHTTHKETK